ncbi:MAG: hypothetical protein ACI88H_000110 [Cocleimonas sp.]|jgi:hypothetical protein
MSIQKAIEKMKAEYEQKIQNCDVLIADCRKRTAIARKSGCDSEADFVRKDRAIEQAKRQAYVQAKYDFDSLFDYV